MHVFVFGKFTCHVVCGWIVRMFVIKHLHVVGKRGDQAMSIIWWTPVTNVVKWTSTCCLCGWSGVDGDVRSHAMSAWDCCTVTLSDIT